MSKFRLDEDGIYIADSNLGTVEYPTAVRDTVNLFMDEMRMAIENLVDDIQYLAHEEAMDPGEARDE